MRRRRLQRAEDKSSLPTVSSRKRLVALFAIVAILFTALIGRTGYIQIVQASWLQQKAQEQWTSDKPVAAQRGSILDRNGEVLAQSAAVDTVLLRPAQIKDPQSIAAALSPILGMDEAAIIEKASDKTKGEVWLKRQITREQANQIRSLSLKGVDFTLDMKRYYPKRTLLEQVIGFTSLDGNGLEGIEAKYNKYLAGVPGRIVEETDRSGQNIPLGGEVYVPPQDGYDVVLTIDYAIQSFLEKACAEAYENNKAKSVQGIVMDVKTGEILGMANKPDFDLNDPPRDDAELLASLSRNRAVVDVFEPGSTFKVFTLASCLDKGLINESTSFYCPGYRMVDGEKIKCWRFYNPHGSQTLAEAVQNSCNPAFMDMALKLGIEQFYDYIYKFGFGQSTGIDFISDEQGIVRHQKYIRNTDLARIGFGQSIAVTSIQMITGLCAAVNGGTLMRPYLVRELRDQDGNVIREYGPQAVRTVISAETSELMRKLLEGVVREGSGRNASIPGYRVGGKTGTAQKYQDGKVLQGKHVASFIGFAPADDPKIAVFILVDEPDVAVDFGSVVAAPYFKQVMESTLRYLGVPKQYSDAEIARMTKTVEIPNVIGMDLDTAINTLRQAGLQSVADGTGTVRSMLPGPGTVVSDRTIILLYMSEKQSVADTEGMVEVPDLKGLSILEANAVLASHGLKLKVNGSGIAVHQKQTAGSMAPEDSVIEVDFEPPPGI
ncbi:MAG: stage V sporulation protein D [Bacillota bacterium]|nr:stage V sporulation protein D [Bacillota bacterium]